MAIAIAFGSQAQIGSLIGGAVRKGVQKSVEKKVEQAVEQKTDELLGNNNRQQRTANNAESSVQSAEEGDHIPTPEEVMAMVPKIPTFQNIADYMCEQSRDNPRTLKLLANPTTAFHSQMTIAAANGYVTMVASNGSIYTLDEQLRDEFGITDEQYAAMSDEEQQALAERYRAELEQRYARTVEILAADDEYNRLVDEYNAIDDQVRKLQSDAENECRKIWADKHAASGDLCAYYRDAVPVCYHAVMQGLDMRKNKQLAVAKRVDEHVQKLAQKRPHEVFAGFFNMAGLCATAYVTDAALVTSIPDPR